MRDIVYILKKDIDPYELTYSLRSVEKNFPHNRVWFVGYKPEGLTPDVELYHEQGGVNKWDLIRSSMWKAVHDDRLTNEFFLFNDDFFVMKKVKGEFVNFAEKTLSWRVDRIFEQYKWGNMYARTLIKAREELKTLGSPEVNFEVHLPMLMNKQKVIESIYKVSSPQMRSVYGNINGIDYIERDDVKVYDLETVPDDPDYLSTNEDTFRNGAVGEFIRSKFKKPSRFEK